jgi:hypothetical protein
MNVSKKLLNIAEVPHKDDSSEDLEAAASRPDSDLEAASSPAGPEIRQIIVRQGSGWQTTALLFFPC